MRFIFVASLMALAGCSAEPRSASYFEENPDERARVLEGCRAGSHRGEECQTADAADAKQRADAERESAREMFKSMAR